MSLNNVLKNVRLDCFSKDFSLNDFSWCRIKIVLLNVQNSMAVYEKNSLILTFPHRGQIIVLNINGRGFLTIKRIFSQDIIYKFVMPKDIQKLVRKLWELNRLPHVYDRKLN